MFNLNPDNDIKHNAAAKHATDQTGNVDVETLDNVLADQVIHYRGDVNNDGQITFDDLKEIAQIIKDIDFDPSDPKYDAADLNEDGFVDRNDIALLRQRLKGPKTGDMNYDGAIDYSDLDIVDEFLNGTILLTAAEHAALDFNGDGKFSEHDIKAFEKRFEDRANGDLNHDGKVNETDLSILEGAVRGKYILTDAEKAAAKMDKSSELSREDVKILKKRLEHRSKGDVNNDGKLDKSDLSFLEDVGVDELLTEAEVQAVDMNGDGVYTEEDLELFRARFNPTNNLDFNGDDKLTEEDINIMSKMIAKGDLVTDEELHRMDLNKDDKLDAEDIDTFAKRFEGRRKKDLNNDGVFDKEDLQILDAFVKQENVLLTEAEMKAADLDGDGEVTKNDLYLLAKSYQAQQSGSLDLNDDEKLTTEDLAVMREMIAQGHPIKGAELHRVDLNRDGELTEEDAALFATRFERRSKMDINNDGVFDLEDAKILNKFVRSRDLLLTDAEMEAADLDGDGRVTSKDLSLMDKIYRQQNQPKN